VDRDDAEISARRGRLLTRPAGAPPAGPAPPGIHPLGLDVRRDGLLVIPPASGPLPLLVWLHGAGGDARGILRLVETQAEDAGIALLIPESRGPSWDVIRGGLGPDVLFLDAALRHAFGVIAANPARIAIGGFSDGASYALTLGLANGDLFGRILAFSPGFAVPPDTIGKPAIFVSHGRSDEVLPIDPCSRRLVPRLQAAGYALRYEEFDGGHVVPGWAVTEAFAPLRTA
jgi:phospholipase/carboxylesterase